MSCSQTQQSQGRVRTPPKCEFARESPLLPPLYRAYVCTTRPQKAQQQSRPKSAAGARTGTPSSASASAVRNAPEVSRSSTGARTVSRGRGADGKNMGGATQGRSGAASRGGVAGRKKPGNNATFRLLWWPGVSCDVVVRAFKSSRNDRTARAVVGPRLPFDRACLESGMHEQGLTHVAEMTSILFFPF